MQREGQGAAIPPSGSSTFAEDPDRTAPEARLIWHADLDPGTLRVVAEPAADDDADADALFLDRLAPWLTIAVDAEGREHAVLSDGWHHIRLDVEAGSLLASRAVVLHYEIAGIARAEPKVLPLRRFLALARHRRFMVTLFPPEPRIGRLIDMLRVHDALVAGASQREIAEALFGRERASKGWHSADSWRSRVRRLIADARAMAAGGFWSLMNGPARSTGRDRAMSGIGPGRGFERSTQSSRDS